ncbi:MAG TPA: hypothetical protein DCY12_00200 [Candidatus Atribacteria bacterium]|nr:hypothetical protein [Candidatus Atribacteria bacterium]
MKNIAVFFLIFMVSMSFLYLSLQAEIVGKGFVLSLKNKRIESLVANKDRIEIEISHLSSMDRIKEIATNKLGMVLPEKTIFLAAADQKVQLKGSEAAVAEHVNETGLKR